MKKLIFTGLVIMAVGISAFCSIGLFADSTDYDYDTWVRDEQLRQATVEYDYDTWTRPDVKVLIEQER